MRGEEWTIEIEGMADRGRAIGRHQGKAVFVPFAAPGDVARVIVEREKASYAEARLAGLVHPSPLRRAPACPHFGSCGGCAWQHLDYETQTRGKDKSFTGFCRTRLGEAAFAPFLPSPSDYGYRNRVALTLTQGPRPAVGFLEESSHRVVPIRRCPVLDPALEALLPALPRVLSSPVLRPLSPRRVRLQLDGEGRLWGTLEAARAPSRAARASLPALARELGLADLGVESPEGRVSPGARDALMPFPFCAGETSWKLGVPPGGFCQANPGVNALLREALLARRDLFSGLRCLDLYAGSGNFTLPMAALAKSVLAVESARPAARALAANTRDNGLGNVEVRDGEVHRVLGKIPPGSIDFCLLDPPREGAADALDPLLALAPRTVAYISCAPPTLARDLARLLEGGYRLVSLRAADMFPQTAHVESLALLSRSPEVDGVF